MNVVFGLKDIKKDLARVETFLLDYVQFEHLSLRESSLHYLKAGGKRIRPTFVLLAGRLFVNEKEILDKLIPLAACVELIHMTSLIHDDVIDRAETRRGKPTVRVLWGNKFSLHAGDYILAQASKLIEPQKNPKIADILAKVSVEMCKGEIIQLASTYDVNQSVKDYFYRIKRKTALLISASCQIGAIAVNAPRKYIYSLYQYGHFLGMAFQIKDDILDMTSNSKTLGKPAGNDLAQGIITLPTIFTLQLENAESQELKKMIQNKFPRGNADIQKAIEIIKKNGGLDKAMDVSIHYIKKAKEQLKFLPPNPYLKKMDKLADYIAERNF